MTTTTRQQRQCPICSKTLSYAGAFSKHGYRIKHRQHDLGLCFGSYKPEDGLIESYMEFLEVQSGLHLQNFPSEWLHGSIFSKTETSQREAWASFRAFKQIESDIKYFAGKIANA